MSNKYFFWLIFMTLSICCHACSISTKSEHQTATVSEKPLSTNAEDDEVYEMPDDHATYSSAMCVHCHPLTSLTESHRGVSDDECLDCHQLGR